VTATAAALVQRIRGDGRCVTRSGVATSRLEEALSILDQVGLPIADYSARFGEKVGLALLALADLTPDRPWSEAKDIDGHTLGTRGVIWWLQEYYSETRKDSSYDYVWRNDLRDMWRAGYVLNTGGSSRNDSTRAYGLEPGFAALLRTFGSRRWQPALTVFMSDRPSFAALADVERDVAMVVSGISYNGDPVEVELLGGAHNALIRKSVHGFLTRFGYEARLLYLGDADDRDLYRDAGALDSLGIDLEDLLPDVVAISAERGWLFIIEAVHSRGPVSHEKHERFEALLRNWRGRVVYVTTFEDRKAFRKSLADIAWETEVWLADEPDHLIHFNGERFLGPHPPRGD